MLFSRLADIFLQSPNKVNIISVRVLLGNQLHDHGPNCCGLFALLVELKQFPPVSKHTETQTHTLREEMEERGMERRAGREERRHRVPFASGYLIPELACLRAQQQYTR